MRVVAVRAGDETFALPVHAVGPVVLVEHVTRAPLAGDDFLGLTNMRGRVLALVDLRKRLNPAAPGVSVPTLAVCIDADSESYALAVDDVGDVHDLSPDQQIDVPAHAGPSRAALTSALFRLPSGLLPVLDVTRLIEPAPRRAADAAPFAIPDGEPP